MIEPLPSGNPVASGAERASSLRSQLMTASVFPLAFFLLVATLMITAAFRQVTILLVLPRNTALVEAAAAAAQPAAPGSQGALYRVAAASGALTAVGSAPAAPAFDPAIMTAFIKGGKADSRLLADPSSGDELVVAYAPQAAGSGGLLLVESLARALAPVAFYEAILIALLVLGALFSLYTLTLSLGRVTGPIAGLVEHARRAVPGSSFRPMPEQGPTELRELIRAFNQMVVRLAGQQTSLRQYAHKALLSQEEERQRLSHELHDGTLQDLIGLAQRVELCRNEMGRDPELARRRLDELQELVQTTLADVRRMSNALRPPILEDLGLPAAVEALCHDLETQMPSVRCSFVVTGERRRLTPDLELAAFRVVQEALANIRKHALAATRVEVEMAFTGSGIEATVRNNGPVFPSPDVRSLVRGGHLGLAGMYERARLFHGQLSLSSDPAAGTTVRLTLPDLPVATEAEAIPADRST